jgi:RND family efflux transporter MFP subunit
MGATKQSNETGTQTMTDQNKPSIMRRVLYVFIRVVFCAVLVGGAVAVIYWIYSTEPKAQREGATRKTAALVETFIAEPGTYRPALAVLGNVQPEREITISTRVGGEVTEIDPLFVDGGFVEKGQTLVTIDPADYENELTLRESELKQIMAELSIEQGRQAVARKELDALGQDLSDDNRSLVLREPQIESIRARVKAAEAAVGQAQLNLKRTRITAPFNAQIMTTTADLGSQVSPGDTIARLVGTERFWVVASVPQRNLGRMTFPRGDEVGSPVQITLESVWGEGVSRQGRVLRLLGELDPSARLAQVLIVVDDPLALQSDGPPLLLDTIVQANIDGKALSDVYRLPRDVLRQNDTVWLYNEGELAIRKVNVVFGNAEYIFVSEGLEPGDEIVITPLASVAEGRPLRRVGEDAPEPDEQETPE